VLSKAPCAGQAEDLGKEAAAGKELNVDQRAKVGAISATFGGRK
jgi:hypothetical protein